jgi:hypothetical protein
VVAGRGRKQRGKKEGGGLLIDAGYYRNGRGIKGIKREGASYCAEETVVGVVNARKKMALAGGSHLSAGVGRKWVPVRERFPGPRARSGAGPDCFPRGLFMFFSSLLLFFFYFSYFFHRFCKNAPNQFKPLSKNLQNSQQGFKPIGNKFLKPKQDF